MSASPEPEQTALQSAAAAYASHGVVIFPCWWTTNGACACGQPKCHSPGKHPIGSAVPQGVKDASCDPDTVAVWWDAHPRANVAIALEPNHVFAVDVDGPQGRRRLDELEASYAPLPDTYQVVTGRAEGNGRHYLFNQPADGPAIRSGKLGDPKLETKGAGGYVIAPPSIHATGRAYLAIGKWSQIADPPAWLVAIARPQPSPAATTTRAQADPGEDNAGRRLAALADTVAAAEDGNRNDLLFWATCRAGGLVAAGRLHQHDVEQALRQAARHCDLDDHEIGKTLASGIKTGAQAPDYDDSFDVPPVTVIEPPDADTLTEFWQSRPQLAHLHQFARARRASPWAVLATALVRMSVNVPPHHVLPAIIGGQASLNLFAGIVARSGGGKGAADAAASDALRVGPIRSSGVGSGEGILHQYVRHVPENKKTGEPAHIEQHNASVLFTAGEVDTLGALHARQSSTLLSELRKVYMGEELSFAYVDITKRLIVEKHGYRAGLIVGIQPTRAGVLLDDADGGTPQRFVWMPGTDPEMPDVAPDAPTPLTWELPKGPKGSPFTGNVVVDVCDIARDTIDTEHVKRNRGEGDALDGHALLTRLKWAAAFGYLDGRVEVRDDDWQLAGTLMGASDATRTRIVADLNREKVKANKAKGLADAERDVIREETVSDAGLRRVCRVVMQRIEPEGERSRSDLRKAIAYRDRGYFDAAVERLVEAGQVEVDDEGKGTTYRIPGRAL